MKIDEKLAPIAVIICADQNLINLNTNEYEFTKWLLVPIRPHLLPHLVVQNSNMYKEQINSHATKAIYNYQDSFQWKKYTSIILNG